MNDLHGRPLLVVTEEVRGNLAKSLPAVIAAVRQVVGDRRFTVIFDRGGYDGQLFKWLLEQGLDFITYQRGDVHLADEQFARREVRWDGQRVRFRLAEDAVKVGESGPWRRIVIRAPDGHQTPILTSVDAATLAAARVTALSRRTAPEPANASSSSHPRARSLSACGTPRRRPRDPAAEAAVPHQPATEPRVVSRCVETTRASFCLDERLLGLLIEDVQVIGIEDRLDGLTRLRVSRGVHARDELVSIRREIRVHFRAQRLDD